MPLLDIKHEWLLLLMAQVRILCVKFSLEACRFSVIREPDKYKQSQKLSNLENFKSFDQSIGSTKTKYIKLNTLTQIFLLITFNFCIHFKRENFFFSSCFHVAPVKLYKKSRQIFISTTKNILGFSIWIYVFGISRCNGLINGQENY